MPGFFISIAVLIAATTGIVVYRRKKFNHK
jgi:hypothetical protein